MHGAREGWKRDRGKERASLKERERERERESCREREREGGRPIAVVSLELDGCRHVAARATVCRVASCWIRTGF